MSKATIRSITATLGTDAMCERLGVSEHSIRHARHVGQFPASWFDAVEAMCRAEGLACPRSLFNFKSPSGSSGSEVSACSDEVVNGTDDCKGADE